MINKERIKTFRGIPNLFQDYSIKDNDNINDNDRTYEIDSAKSAFIDIDNESNLFHNELFDKELQESLMNNCF